MRGEGEIREGEEGIRWRHSPGLPVAELAAPSASVKWERRTEGSGSACAMRLVCTSLYTEARRPGVGPLAEAPLEVATAAAAMRCDAPARVVTRDLEEYAFGRRDGGR
jgi:hypothetical protein